MEARATGKSAKENHGSTSTIVIASIVASFIVLGLSSVVLFLRITRVIRWARERRRMREALTSKEKTSSELDRDSDGVRKRVGKNAFDDFEWEGTPVQL